MNLENQFKDHSQDYLYLIFKDYILTPENINKITQNWPYETSNLFKSEYELINYISLVKKSTYREIINEEQFKQFLKVVQHIPVKKAIAKIYGKNPKFKWVKLET